MYVSDGDMVLVVDVLQLDCKFILFVCSVVKQLGHVDISVLPSSKALCLVLSVEGARGRLGSFSGAKLQKDATFSNICLHYTLFSSQFKQQ